MGCDIHLYAEVKKRKGLFGSLLFWKPKKWVNIDKWTKNKYYGDSDSEPLYTIERENRFYTFGRNYNLFSALCGVRSYYFEDAPLSISDPKGLPIDVSDVVRQESDSWGSDGHSHSYNSLKELKDFDWSPYGETVKDFLGEVIPKMEAQNVKDTDVRIVYFFDN